MDAFVVSLPRGPKKNSDKRKASGGSASNGRSASSSPFGAKSLKKAKFSFRPKERIEKEKQTFLDLGQKSFGANKNCKLCGMFFVIGDVAVSIFSDACS